MLNFSSFGIVTYYNGNNRIRNRKGKVILKRIISILILSFMFLNLTGCTSNFKINEDLVKDLSDKITENVINTVDKEKIEKNETHNLDASNSIELVINGSVGEIKVTSHESKEAIVDANIIAKSKDKEKAKKLLDEYKYTVKSTSNAIKIDTAKTNNLIIIDDMIEVNLNIKIPISIKHITIVNNVGDIELENVNGELKISNNVGETYIKNSNCSYNVKTDVGEINLSNCIVVGESEFNTNTGDIRITATDISNANNIVAEAQVGDIKMQLPETSNYKAEINEFMEKERTEVHGDGKTNIKLITNVGDIDFK